MNVEELVAELVAVRKNSGLRQVDVAEQLGISQPAVSELESGAVSPKWSTLVKYAAALGLKIQMEIVPREEESDD